MHKDKEMRTFASVVFPPHAALSLPTVPVCFCTPDQDWDYMHDKGTNKTSNRGCNAPIAPELCRIAVLEIAAAIT